MCITANCTQLQEHKPSTEFNTKLQVERTNMLDATEVAEVANMQQTQQKLHDKNAEKTSDSKRKGEHKTTRKGQQPNTREHN